MSRRNTGPYFQEGFFLHPTPSGRRGDSLESVHQIPAASPHSEKGRPFISVPHVSRALCERHGDYGDLGERVDGLARSRRVAGEGRMRPHLRSNGGGFGAGMRIGRSTITSDLAVCV